MGVLIVIIMMISAMIILNMLVGVLVEVVATVMRDEKVRMAESVVRGKMKELMETTSFDKDGDGRISHDEFNDLLTNRKAALMIQDVGVDVVGLVDFSEWIFRENNIISFDQVVDLVMSFSSNSVACVRDVSMLHRTMSDEAAALAAQTSHKIEKAVADISREIR